MHRGLLHLVDATAFIGRTFATTARCAGRPTRMRVRRFHPIYGDATDRAPDLRVAPALVLVDSASGDTVASARASARRSAEGNRIGAIVAGLQERLAESLAHALATLAHEVGRPPAREAPTGSGT